MAGGHKPRSGSLAFYPRVRAKRHFASFTSYPLAQGAAKPLNFYGYKAGMVTAFGKNAHQKSVNYGVETAIPATVIECPPVKIIGARVYEDTFYGPRVVGEATIEKPDRNLRRKLKAFKKAGKKAKEEKKYNTISDLEKLVATAEKVTLIAEMQPSMTGMGKKKADIAEINLAGGPAEQFAFAKEKFGKEIRASEVIPVGAFVDVKAVTKGHGFAGVVKRFGVKIHRPKAKKHRYVGSIGPWHPATVMWTVPRAGQHGYHTRTELNKRVLFVESDPKAVNPSSGFEHYGNVKSDYIVVVGSIPGARKRPVSLRMPIRKPDENQAKYTDLRLPKAAQESRVEETEARPTKEKHAAGKK